MRYLGVMILAIVLATGASAQGDMMSKSQPKAASKTYSGYVVDQMCGGGMEKKSDPMSKAAAHTKECALESHCAESGFGLFIKGKYHPFDSTGSGLAKSMIEKSTRTDHLYAEVTGTMKGSTLEVNAIKESDPPKK